MLSCIHKEHNHQKELKP